LLLATIATGLHGRRNQTRLALGQSDVHPELQ
jgi:hypothetical protein